MKLTSRIEAQAFLRRFLLALGLVVLVQLSAIAAAVTYTYDALGRLKSAIYANGSSVTYSYDAAGNRTSVVTALPSSLQASTGSSWNYTIANGVVQHVDNPLVVVATGGTSPYTYSWERTSGDASTTATTPTSVSTSFSRTVNPQVNATYQSIWRCKVTDAVSAIAYTANVTVTFVVIWNVHGIAPPPSGDHATSD